MKKGRERVRNLIFVGIWVPHFHRDLDVVPKVLKELLTELLDHGPLIWTQDKIEVEKKHSNTDLWGSEALLKKEWKKPQTFSKVMKE